MSDVVNCPACRATVARDAIHACRGTGVIAKAMIAVALENGHTLRGLTYYMHEGELKEAIERLWPKDGR